MYILYAGFHHLFDEFIGIQMRESGTRQPGSNERQIQIEPLTECVVSIDQGVNGTSNSIGSTVGNVVRIEVRNNQKEKHGPIVLDNSNGTKRIPAIAFNGPTRRNVSQRKVCGNTSLERDQDIEPFWSNPRKYIPKLLKFQGVIGLDYSTCVDFPLPLKEWNIYRNRVCNYMLQTSGIETIPVLRGDPDTIEREIAGLDRGRAIAVSPRGCVKNPDDRRRFIRGSRLLIDRLEPSLVISYGPISHGVLEYPIGLGIPVHAYASRGRGDLGGGTIGVKVL